MKNLYIFLILLFIFSSQSFSEQKYVGIWSDETRQSPANPSNFICIEKLSDGRFFIISNHTDNKKKLVWETSIGTIKNAMLYATFDDGEWKFKIGINKMNIEYLTMEAVDNPDMIIGLGRVSEQPIKKLEGTVRKENFTK